jgi:hypothetical protein
MSTKHAQDCKMAFGRKDKSCPRCQELLAGAAPRKGWGMSAREKALEEQRFSDRLRNHKCQASGCGVVCTAFDW